MKILLCGISEIFLPMFSSRTLMVSQLIFKYFIHLECILCVVIYTIEFYAAERKKELLPSVTAWMELESIMLSEISQVVKDKYHTISPLTGT